ncbi:WD repeat-containing protein 70 isoform X4 [Ictalurus punctatus]|uniref:WD repeat-containing protein 70 n=1 Tax=Ictalurus punctatus TaxID=7998 RepID=A0A2D0SQ75_ICTPU|nr:WD repeat-containing protein 70 isoform X4 [Ictalurus punctatus]
MLILEGKMAAQRDSDGGEEDVSSVMGFSGFGRKARTFDLEAIFEQTRRTAIERSQRVLEDRQQQESQSSGPSAASSRTSASSQKQAASTSSRQKESDDSSDSELIGPPLPPPPALSAQADDDDDDGDAIGPPLPPGFSRTTAEGGDDDDGGSDDDDDDDDDSMEEEDDDPVKKIPDTHEITLQHGTKTVSALGLDTSGARLVTGGFDFDVKFWDFAGMDAALQAFRSLQPCECHQIKSLQYSITGDVILVVAGNAQAKVLDRDGFQVLECTKGDQYIVDMANTKGHTAMLNSGCWHPKIKEEFLTCSNDGTVRTWDLNNEKKHKSVFKPRSVQGKRVTPTCCTYSRDGKLIAAGCQDGTIQIWDRNLSVHTKFHCRQAHAVGSDTSCLTFSYDGTTLASRGGDDTLKTWDIRNFKKPLNVATGLCSFFPMTDCCFSPDDKLLVTGTSVKRDQGNGKLVFFDRESFKKVYEIEVASAGRQALCGEEQEEREAGRDADAGLHHHPPRVANVPRGQTAQHQEAAGERSTRPCEVAQARAARVRPRQGGSRGSPRRHPVVLHREEHRSGQDGRQQPPRGHPAPRQRGGREPLLGRSCVQSDSAEPLVCGGRVGG